MKFLEIYKYILCRVTVIKNVIDKAMTYFARPFSGIVLILKLTLKIFYAHESEAHFKKIIDERVGRHCIM